LIGGAGEKDAQNLYEFGINIGLAFQLKDDLLDVYGDETTFGKKIGGDILCNKKTYLLIQALQLAKGNDVLELRKWIETSDEVLSELKIKAVTEIYEKLEVKSICEEKMHDFYTKAIANLENVSVFENKKHELRKLAEKLMFRTD
jgi:geranylgeranyl diphosphate synthase, type II